MGKWGHVHPPLAKACRWVHVWGVPCVGSIVWGTCMWDTYVWGASVGYGVCVCGGVHTCRVHKEDRDPQALTFRLGGSGSYRGAIQVIPG